MDNSFSCPVVLSVAGSDSGGGAGIQADLRAFSFFNTFGTTAITAVTAQNPSGVNSIESISPSLVADQIQAVLDEFRVGAVKTGMLFSREIIEVVVAQLNRSTMPLVVDPVMVASSGAVLLREEALDALQSLLLPRATVITPNLPEAEIILKKTISGGETLLLSSARELHRRFGCAVILKGGHGAGLAAVDYLVCDQGSWRFTSPWVTSPTSHGTGCLFSAGLAAGLARGVQLVDAVVQAKALVVGCLRNCVAVGVATHGLTAPPELLLSEVSSERIA